MVWRIRENQRHKSFQIVALRDPGVREDLKTHAGGALVGSASMGPGAGPGADMVALLVGVCGLSSGRRNTLMGGGCSECVDAVTRSDY